MVTVDLIAHFLHNFIMQSTRQEVPSPTPTPTLKSIPVNSPTLMLNYENICTAHLRICICLFPSPLPDDDSSESGSANGLPALTSPEVLAVGGNVPDGGASYGEVAENGVSAPLDFSTTSSSSSSEDQQPVNLSDRLLPAGSSPPNSYPADPNRKYPIKTEYTNKVTAETWCALITINSRVSV